MRTADAIPTMVKAKIASTHRLNIVNAATGERVGKVNVRPDDTAAFTDADLHTRASMFCELFNAMHPDAAYHLAPTELVEGV